MTLGAVTFKNFTVFEDATFELCLGVNVLIGANATGKRVCAGSPRSRI